MNKVKTLDQAVRSIKNDDVIMLGGFMTVGTPELLVDAVVAKDLTGLTIVCNDAGVPGKGAGKFVRQGSVKTFYASHVGLNPEFGKAMTEGRIEAILVPQGTLAERIRAAGVGLGGILTPTGVGTEVEKGKETIVVDGRAYLLEPPIKGDVALIKAHRADRAGNVIFRKSAQNFNPLMAMACEYVVVEAEHIEDTGTMDPDHVMLPGIFVDAVVQAGEVENG
ncbi:CoA transferase subunit A [Desulfoluna spongiiphila]|uniref:Acetate CoA/acetoacetate CoA-transferase alpha subunit n=1 Tax=Desulfoluna spongiiphila TaxID=419481 RepID=A0A1G5IZT0_9BACT|nr:CoA transferase subunit A [Desulfoluna spongiiphila]SCY81414.1 acetate CoA/acetoacetate CoA-transferase alpha subunit [Desulfoluna spongiiphila]VVS91797.1 3-oxoacid coa-transferase subunit a [Desulfoluna spongiiphila]